MTPISERCGTNGPEKRPSHDVDAPEAGRDRHLHGTLVGLLEEPPGSLDAQLKEIAARRGAELVGEHPRKVPRAHRHAIGVFYRVQEERVVIELIGRKKGDVLLIEGKEFEL